MARLVLPQALGKAAAMYSTRPSGFSHAHDQHVLGQPAFALAEVAGDAQGEALLAQQHVAAVAGADAPDGVVLGEVQDQPALDVQVGLAVQALGELAAGAELLEHRRADVGHDPHVQHDVDAVGQLDADLAEGRADRAHREGDHVHRAALHRAGEDLLRPAIAFVRRHPVVRRAGVFARAWCRCRSGLRSGRRRWRPCGDRGSPGSFSWFNRVTSPVAAASCVSRSFSSSEPSIQTIWSGSHMRAISSTHS